jgi:acyl-CoA synthetase (AMP-forming)/AMP-acid ligase II/thioesterase domain-containing protein
MREALNGMGLGRNDRVAIVLPNGPEMAAAFLAVAAAATCAPLNPDCRASEFHFYLTDLRAKALLVQPGVAPAAVSTARDLGIPIIELTPLAQAEAGIFRLHGPRGAIAKADGFSQEDDEALVLHTSGTTSRPKLVPLTQGNLCTSARNIRSTLLLCDQDRTLNVMPLFHIHGLVGALLSSLTAGASVVCAPGFHAPSFFEWLKAFRPTWYTAVPTIHQAILARAPLHQEIIASCRLRFLRSCSSPLTPQLKEQLEGRFRVPVIEAYGMTEASHQITSNPLPGRERRPGSVGLATGTSVSIMDDKGNILPPGEQGEVVVRGANLTRGYEKNPKANEEAFSNGWFRTGDLGYLDADGYLYLTGRIKEQINRGGEKISPREIDEVLLDHPAVAQALTFAVPHAQLGEEVAAAIVLRATTTATAQELQTFAATRLCHFKVPRQVLFLPELPKGPTGKPQRIGLAEKLGLTGSAQRRQPGEAIFAPPRTPLEETLARIWREVLAVEQVGIREDFFQAGGDSLLAANLMSRIQSVLGQSLPLETLLQGATIEYLADVLSRPPGPSSLSCLVELQPHGSRPPFFLVHGIGGEVFSFANLARHFDHEQPFYGFRAPPSRDLPAGAKKIEVMAADYLRAMRSVQPRGPYFLGGYSFGGTVAYEMAQQLRQQQQQVAVLAVLDHPAPALPSARAARKLTGLVGFLGNLPYWLVDDFLQAGFRDLLTRNRIKINFLKQRVCGALRSHRSSSAQRDIEWVFDVTRLDEPFRKLLEEHRQALTCYVPRTYRGRVQLFRARAQALFSSHRWDLGWGKLTDGKVDIRVIPGCHSGNNSILNAPHVQVLARQLTACLRQAQAVCFDAACVSMRKRGRCDLQIL